MYLRAVFTGQLSQKRKTVQFVRSNICSREAGEEQMETPLYEEIRLSSFMEGLEDYSGPKCWCMNPMLTRASHLQGNHLESNPSCSDWGIK